jgi:hypothetical protein
LDNCTLLKLNELHDLGLDMGFCWENEGIKVNSLPQVVPRHADTPVFYEAFIGVPITHVYADI